MWRRIEGTFQVPLYLTKGGVPGSRLILGKNGKPTYARQQPAGALPLSDPGDHVDAGKGPAKPARMSIYGHGLLGELPTRSARTWSRDMAATNNIVYCGTNWIGLAEEDIGNAVAIARRPVEVPRHPRSLAAGLPELPVPRAPDEAPAAASSPTRRSSSTAKPLIDTTQLYYDGNSQGAILGGALTAVAQDFTRGVLGEAGMNYSLLLAAQRRLRRLPLVLRARPTPTLRPARRHAA